MASSLNSVLNGSLLLCSKTALLAANDAAVGIYKSLQKLHVLVVDVADVVLGENVIRHICGQHFSTRMSKKQGERRDFGPAAPASNN